MSLTAGDIELTVKLTRLEIAYLATKLGRYGSIDAELSAKLNEALDQPDTDRSSDERDT